MDQWSAFSATQVQAEQLASTLAQQATLAQLAVVFLGGFTLEAARAVVAGSQPAPQPESAAS